MKGNTEPSPNDPLTTDEAAAVLGVSGETVTRWWDEGLLDAFCTPTGRRRFRRGEVEALLAKQHGPHARRYRGLDLSAYADNKLRARFWAKVDASGDCWIWTASIMNRGYGQFTVSKTNFHLAHVVSYAITHGPVPPGFYVCHRCDNPPCVRPDHLFLGSPVDNSLDMFAKGRQGTRHPGAERANARLTDEDVRAIRAAPPYYGRTAALARRYGVSQTTIRKILCGQKWRHVA